MTRLDRSAMMNSDVAAFLKTIEDPQKRADAEQIGAMMFALTGAPAALWRGNVIGFGRVKYRYPTGTAGETYITGFAPRKSKITLYTLWYESEKDPLLAELGQHSHGKGCLHIKRLSDVKLDVLEQIIRRYATNLSRRFIVED